ncbi:hypothetical protein HDU96_002525 [Phlyctochytrium bullatum]|nr:hypothetical protein HDU96_002525 [Phlyctochytrium bullatum]
MDAFRDSGDANQAQTEIDVRNVADDDGALRDADSRQAHNDSSLDERTIAMDLVRHSARSRTKPVFFDPSAEVSKRPRVEGIATVNHLILEGSRKKPDQGKKRASGVEQSHEASSLDFHKLKEELKDEVMQSLELRDDLDEVKRHVEEHVLRVVKESIITERDGEVHAPSLTLVGTKTWLCSPSDIAAAISPFLKKSALKANSTLDGNSLAFEGLAKAFKDVVFQSLVSEVSDAVLPQVLDKVNDHLQSAVPKLLETGNHTRYSSRADYYAKKVQASSASAANHPAVPKERTFFKHLNDALALYRTLLSADKVLIADEYLPKGERRFGVFTTRELFEGVASVGSKACFYEVIPIASPCKLYFDVDIKEKDVFADDFKLLSNSRKEMIAGIQESVTSYFQQHYQLIAPPEMIVLSGCRQGKISFHVVFNIMFPTLDAVKAAVKEIVDDVAAFEEDQRNNAPPAVDSVIQDDSTASTSYVPAVPAVTAPPPDPLSTPALNVQPPISSSPLAQPAPHTASQPLPQPLPHPVSPPSSGFVPPPPPPLSQLQAPAATCAVEIPPATLQRVLKTMKKHNGYSGGLAGVRVKGYDTTVVISPRTENCFCVIAGEVHQGPRCPIYFVWPEDTDIIYQKCQKCKDKISESFTLEDE